LILISLPVRFEHALVYVVSNGKHVFVDLCGISRIELDPRMETLRWRDFRVALRQFEARTFVAIRNDVNKIGERSGALGREVPVRIGTPVCVYLNATSARRALNVCRERLGRKH